MIHPVSDDQVCWLRLRGQHLDSPLAGTEGGAAQVVRDLAGVQAQDANAAALAVRVRCAGLVKEDVERARVEQRSIVRSWFMRGTLHLVPAEDVGWLLGLLGPIFVRANRRRRIELGLDDQTAEHAVRALRDVLAEQGPLTRGEIVEHLGRRGIALAGQARPHLLALAALQGLICYGPSRGREETYVLLTNWIRPGPELPPEVARAELALRYLAAYAPSAPEDFAAWSGLSLGEARAAWQHVAAQTAEVVTGSGPMSLLKTQEPWLDQPAAPRAVVRLLPSFDTLLLGYRQRDLLLAPERTRRINAGGGMLHPALLVDGRVAGTWKIARRGNDIDIKVNPFRELGPEEYAGLEAEVEDVARFLESTATVQVAPPG